MKVATTRDSNEPGLNENFDSNEQVMHDLKDKNMILISVLSIETKKI